MQYKEMMHWLEFPRTIYIWESSYLFSTGKIDPQTLGLYSKCESIGDDDKVMMMLPNTKFIRR